MRGSYTSMNRHCAPTRGNTTSTVDITSLLKSADSYESRGYSRRSPQDPGLPRSTLTAPAYGQQPLPPPATSTPPGPPPASSRQGPTMQATGTRRSMPQGHDQPVKKQSKWSAEEDALIIELRGSGMKWEDVSKRLPGRSAISCRLHYQNYLERRSEWDEERKNKLARLYERFKSEMWAKVAEELAVPWRAAEAMHWQLGEGDMARRAGVVPFSLAINVDAANHRSAPAPTPRSNMHHYQHVETPTRHLTPSSPRSIYSQTPSVSAMSIGPGPRSENVSSAPPPLGHGSVMEHGDFYYSSSPTGPGLAPIQHQGQPRNPGPLPSLAELTTGVSPYGTPVPAERPLSAHLSQTSGSKHSLPLQDLGSPLYPQHMEPFSRLKRRASPELIQREGSQRRRLG